MNLFNELKRRNVFRIAGIYAVVAWVLMQVAGTLESSLNLPLWFDSVITAGLLIGFPIALLLAWAFEMTPAGVKPTEALDDNSDVKTDNRFEIFISVGLTVVIALAGWQQFNQPEQKAVSEEKTLLTKNSTSTKDSLITKPIQEEISDNSIAVLPFTDLSPNKDQEYFSDGMAEEILNVLVGVNALKVSSRTSTFRYKNSNLSVPDIAKQLKVRHVLEGSVRKSGETLRITAQLIDSYDDKHLWSETYDRPLTTDNIFDIQDEIAQAIVKALSSHLKGQNEINITVKKATDNLTAYEMFLKARPLFNYRKDLDQADGLLASALELDKNYAQAWELRAAIQVVIHSYGYSELTEQENYNLAETYSRKAIELDKNSALARSVIAYKKYSEVLGFNIKHSLSEIINEYSQAIDINSKMPTSYNWRGLAYMSVGNLSAALNDFNLCIDIEPEYYPCAGNRIIVVSHMGNDQQALAYFESALNKGMYLGDSKILALLARNDNSILFKTITTNTNYLSSFRNHQALYNAFKHPESKFPDLIEEIKKVYENNINYLSNNDINSLVVLLGDFDHKSYAPYVWGAEYKTYRQSPQFKTQIKLTGVYQYWQEQGFPPQCRPIGDDDFECD